MSELCNVWNNAQLTGATPPPPFKLTNNPNAHSLKINNQSRYWLIIMKTQASVDVDRIEPFSYVTIPYEPDLSLRVDTNVGASSLVPDNEFVDYSMITGVVQFSKGSTQFNGSQTVNMSGAQVGINATNVTVNNTGSTASLQDASGTITSSNVSQSILTSNTNRRYFFFQNMSSVDMFLNFGSAATIGKPSLYLPPFSSIVFETMVCPSDTVYAICSVAGAPFTCKYV